MKKRFVFPILFLLVFSLAFTAAAKPTVVEFWPWWLGADRFQSYLSDQIAEFEEQNPDIDVVMKNQQGDIVKKLMTSMAAGEEPDVINLNYSKAYSVFTKGIFEPIELQDPDAGEVYIDSLWDKVQFDGTYHYVFPWYASPAILYYNTEIFEEAGLDPSDPPATWEEMKEYGQQIVENTDKYAFGVDFAKAHYELTHRMGARLFTEDLSQAAFNTEKVANRLTYWNECYEEGIIPKGLPDYEGLQRMFESGKLAMLPIGVSLVSHVKNNTPKLFEKVKFAKYPVSPQGASKVQVSMMGLSVLTSSDAKKEAVKFAEFLTSPEAQIEFSKLATILPSTGKGLSSDPFFQNYEERDNPKMGKAQLIADKTMADAASLIQTRAPAGWNEIKGVVKTQYLKAIKGDKPVKEALNYAETRVNELIKLYE